MKRLMTDHVEQVQSTMFYASSNEIRKGLKGLTQYIEDSVNDKLHDLHKDISRDYLTTLGAQDLGRRAVTTEWQQTVERSVKDIIAASINERTE